MSSGPSVRPQRGARSPRSRARHAAWGLPRAPGSRASRTGRAGAGRRLPAAPKSSGDEWFGHGLVTPLGNFFASRWALDRPHRVEYATFGPTPIPSSMGHSAMAVATLRAKSSQAGAARDNDHMG